MNVTLITGASGGIGEAFARRLAKEGHHLLLVARSESKLRSLCDQLAQQHHINAQYIVADLAAAGSDAVIVAEAEKRGLEINWLINNAGIGSGGDLPEYQLSDHLHMMHLNMDAMVALTYRLLPKMREKRNGVIINVGSMAGFNGIPYMNVYAATKGFVMYFTQALWEENRLYNIQTMLLCPGATHTGFFDAAGIGRERRNSFSTSNMETPEQVVAAAMRGIRKGSLITISGWRNKIGRRVVGLIPVKTGLKLWGNMQRKKLNLGPR